MNTEKIKVYTKHAVSELIAAAGLKKGSILVIGCSSSEVVGGNIGKCSSLEAARAVYDGVTAALEFEKEEIYVAVQCCEHLIVHLWLSVSVQKNTVLRSLLWFRILMRAVRLQR